MSDPVIDVQFSSGTVITSPWLNGVNDFVNFDGANKADLANTSDVTKGAALIGFNGDTLTNFLKNKNNVVITSIASLRNIDKTKYTHAAVTGYYTQGDGGGGLYWYDSTDTTSADNSGTTIVATDGGRWKLSTTGLVTVKQFGAKGDGVTDDTNAFNGGLAAVGVLRVGGATTQYLINGTVTIGTGQWLVFDSPDIVIKAGAGHSGNAVIRLTGYGEYPTHLSGIKGGCTFDLNGSPATSTAIRFGTSSGTIWGTRVDGTTTFYNCPEAIGDEVHATNFVTDCRFGDIFIRYPRQRSVFIRRSRGFLVFRDFYLDNTANTGAITWEAVRFEDMIGIIFNDFEVSGGGTAGSVYQNTQYGLIINGTGQSGATNSYFHAQRILIDSTFGNGFILNNLTNVVINDLYAYANLGYGGQITASTKVQLTNVQITGAQGVTGGSAGQQGLLIDACNRVQIANIISEFNTGTGVLVNNSSDLLISNWRTANNTNNGWAETGTTNICTKVNGRSVANGANSLVQIGTASSSANWVANAGTVRVSDVGVITV